MSFLFVSSPDYPPSAAQYALAKEILARAPELYALFVERVSARLEECEDPGRHSPIEGICICIEEIHPDAPREWDMSCVIEHGNAVSYELGFTEFEPGWVCLHH